MAGFPIYRDVESNSLRFTASKLVIISPAPDYVVLDPSGEEIVSALNSLVYWTSNNSGGGGGGGSASVNTYGDIGGVQFYNGSTFGAVPDLRFNAGKLSVNAQGIFTGNVTVGNSAFFVNTLTNAVGINTNTLAHTLTVNGTAYFTNAVNVLSTLDVFGAVNTANTLTVAGAINALSTVEIVGAVNAVGGLSVLGNAAFDTDTLFIDAVNHRIGINTTTPAEGYVLDVAGTIRAEAFVGSGALDPTDFANGSIGYVKLLNSTPGHVLMINATGNVESIAISGEATLSPTGVLTLGTAGTLTVNALVANTLKVLNSLNALSTLGITGATNALGTLGVSGTLNALGAMNVLGALNALSTVEVLGVLTARSDVNIDSGTLFVDAVGNFVGLGNTSPAHRLRVEGATSLNGAVNALGAIGITGATNALSTLGVAQATNLFSTLGVTGKITGFDQLEISGNAIFDTDTLYVDAVNHRVGIGNTNPGSPNKLVVTGRTLLQSSTGIPLRVGRTSTNYLDVSVNAAGHATLNVYNAGLETSRLGIDSHLMLNQNKTIYLEGATETSISATSSDPKSIVFVTAGDKTLLLANVTSTINSAIRTPNFVSQTSGWRISREGEADFRYIYADEMHVKNFIADLEQALAGGQIIGKSVAVLYQNFTIPAYGQQTTLAVEDLPGATGMAVFQNNDYVILRNFTRPSSGSLEVAECVGKVTNNINGLTGSDGVKYQTWTFTRDSGNNGGLASSGGTIEKGSLVIDYGVEGNGFYEVNAIDGLNACNSPYSQIVTWTGSPATAAASRVTRARLGNLRGITGQAEEYGLIAGNYNDSQYFRASNKAFDLYGIDLQLFSSSTTAAIVLKRGTANTNPYLAIGNAAPTSFTSGTGIWMGRDESVGTDVASAYRFRAGNPSGVRLSWNGSAVLLGSSSDESLVANSQGLYFFNGAETLGYLNNSEWLLGNTSSNHLVIQPTGVTLKEGATERGQFASTTRIGTPTGPRVEIKSDSVKIYKTDVGSPVAGVVLNSDGSGSLSTGNISWDTSGNFNMTGTMTATAGVIGGWTVNSSVIVKDTGTGATSAGLAPTDYPFYAGAVYSGRASAPFRVTPAGSLTATSGSIAGWTLGTSTLTGGNITLNKDGDITVGLGEDVARISATDANMRLWIGSATPASAPFRVAANGEVTATRVKTLNVDQGSTFNGITTFNGGVNALSTLRVYDTVNAFGTVGVTGLFTAFGGSILTGAVNALSTLRVSQAANALSTLGVGGLFTALGNSRLTGAVNVISTLGITDATNALSTLGVGGVFTALNTSRLVGAVNVISTLGISDATNALSTLGVSGAFTALNTSVLTGAANALNVLGVSGTLTALGQLIVVANATFDSGTLFVDSVNNRVGVNTTTPNTQAQIGAKVTLDNSYSYDTDALYVIHQTGTSATALNDPREVLLLSRQGTTGQSTGAAASFRLSRYENVGTNSRSRLDLVLGHGAFLTSPTTVLTALSSGRVGIGTSAPNATLSVSDGTYEGIIQPRSSASGTGLGVGIDVAAYGTNTILNLAGDIQNGGTGGGVNIGMYSSSAWRRALSIRNGGNLLLMPDGFGNVGVGNATPTHLLRVQGTASINGAFTTDTTASFGGATNALTTFGVSGAANALNLLGVSGEFTALSTSKLVGASNALNTLGVSGTLTALGELVVVGNATFDTKTLFVDAVNDRVGIGNNTPGAPNKLVVDGRTLIQSDTETVQLQIAKNASTYLDVSVNAAGHAYLNMTSDVGSAARVGFAEHIMLDQNKRIYLEGATETNIFATSSDPKSMVFTIAGDQTLKLANVISIINSAISSTGHASQLTGWRITREGEADFRYIYADEMHVKNFIADLEQALAGGQIIAKSVAVLYQNFTVPALGQQTTLAVEDLPGASGMAVFQNNDYVILRNFSRPSSGSLSIGECVGKVTNNINGLTGPDGVKYQTWTFTRDSGNNGGNATSSITIEKGGLVIDYGVDGNGFYEVNAIDGLNACNSPYSQIVTWTGSPAAAAGTKVTRARLGNLKGITNQVEEYGLIAGNYNGNQYLRASNKAFDLYGIDLQLFSSSTTAAIVLKRGLGNTNPYLAIGNAAPTSFTSGVGVWMGRDDTVGSDIQSAYRFRVGDPSGDRLSWNGSAVLIGNPTNSHLVANNGVLTFRVSSETHASLSGSEWILGRTSTNHLVINPTGISLNGAGTQYALFAADTRLGVQTDNHLLLNSSAILFRAPSGVANLISINSTSVTVGSNTDFHVRVTNTAVTLNQGTTEYGQFAGNTRLGTAAANHLLLNSSALMFRDSTGANLATMSATAIVLGPNTSDHIYIDTTGVSLREFVGASTIEYAKFAADTRLGVNTTNYLLLNSTAIMFRTSDSQNKNLVTLTANTMVIGKTEEFHTVINSAGITLKNNETDYAQFAANTRIGTATGPRVVANSAGVRVFKDATVAGVVLNADGSGSLSTGNISWDTSGNFNMTGNVTATAGTIGGWTVNSSAIVKDTGTAATSAGLAPIDYPFYAGATYQGRQSAPFRVTPSGSLTATSGTVGGWTLGTASLTGGNVLLEGAGDITVGLGAAIARISATNSDWRLWIGNQTATNAPFRVAANGEVHATRVQTLGVSGTSTFEGPVQFNGAVNVISTLGVTGATNALSTLGVTGLFTTLGGSVLTGAVNALSTLRVSQAANALSTLGVGGVFTALGTSTLTGAVNALGILGVTGAVNALNTFGVSGAANALSTLGVTGVFTALNTSTLTGAVNVLSTLGVTQAANALNTLGVGGTLTALGQLVVVANATFDTDTLFVDAVNNRVGVGTTTLSTRAQVGPKVTLDNSYSYDTDALYVIHQTGTSATALNDPKEVLLLSRQGTTGQATGAAASFRLSRYENVSTNSRTRFDLVLAHDGFLTSPITALTAFSNGSIGIGTTAPRGLLSVANTTGGVTYEAVIRPRSAASGTGLAAGADVASYEQVLNLAGDVLNGSSSGGVNIGTYASGAWRRALSIRNAGNLLLMPDGFGNVGVGNATPTHLLRVEGTTSINGAFTTDTTARFGGATNALTTFGVTGAANALNTLGVSGAFTALSTSTLTGAANALNTLGVAGTLTALGQLVVVGNATFDTNTLFVDAVNDRVGIGNNTPGAPNKLVVDGRTLLQSDTETVQLRVAKNTANYLDVTINSAGHAYLNMTSLADAGGTTRVGFAEHIMLDQNKRIYLEGSTSTSIRGVDATSSINFTTGNEETLKIASPQSTINSALVSGPSIPYASRTTGWGIDRIGGADFRYIYADEMHVKSFIADLEQALAGGQIISKSVAVLYENFTAPANGAPATLKVEYLPGAPSMPVFEANDYVVLRSFTRQNGGLTVGDCVGVVTNPNTDIAAYQSWTFTRAGTGNAGSMPSGTVVKANTLVLDYGTSGSGYYEVTAVDGLYAQNAPYSQIVTWVDSPISTNRTVRARLGNLRGLTSTEGEYGLIAGTYGGNQYFRASNKAFDLYGIDLQLFSSSTTAAIVLKRGASNTNPYIAIGNAAPTSFTSGVGVWMGRDATVGSDIESAYRFRVGDPSGDRLSWNGSAVLIGNPTNSHLVANAGVLTFRVSSETHASLSGSEWVLGRTGTNHLVINATGISLNNAGTQYAQFAADTRLGVQTDNHLVLNNSAILFRAPSGAANLVSINSTSVTVGSNTDFHVRVTNTAVTLNQGTTEYGQFAANTRLGTTSANHLLVNATALMFRDGTSANLATMNATAIEIGTSSTSRTVINTSGVILFTGATEYARFAANTRLGVNNTNHLLLTNSEIIFRTSDLQNKNLATINATTIVMGQTNQFHTLINASTVTLRSNQTDYAQFAVVTRIGPNTSNHLLLSDTALMFRNENSANLATMNTTSIELGTSTTSRAVINTTGVTLLNNDVDYAQFAGITRVGTLTGPRVVIANTGVQIYKDATVAGVVLYSNGAGSLSTGNISWDSSGNFNMTGNVTATAGSIGPWAVNSTAIARETSNPATSAGLAPDDYPFYSGAFFANRSTAPFRVNRSGEVYATNLNHAGGTLSDLLITGKLEIYPGADIRSGATSFTTGNGYWLQQNTTGTFMRVGDPANNQIQWNNTQLEIKSNLLKINSTAIFLPPRTTFAIDQPFAYGFGGASDTKYGTYAFEGIPPGTNDPFRAIRVETTRTSATTSNNFTWSSIHAENKFSGSSPSANQSAEVAVSSGFIFQPGQDPYGLADVQLKTAKVTLVGGVPVVGYAQGNIKLDGGLQISSAAYGTDNTISASNLIGLKVYIDGNPYRIFVKSGWSG